MVTARIAKRWWWARVRDGIATKLMFLMQIIAESGLCPKATWSKSGLQTHHTGLKLYLRVAGFNPYLLAFDDLRALRKCCRQQTIPAETLLCGNRFV